MSNNYSTILHCSLHALDILLLRSERKWSVSAGQSADEDSSTVCGEEVASLCVWVHEVKNL